jgi:peroxiredoxin
MVSMGDTAPEFTVTAAGGEAYNDIDEVSLAAALKEGPVVLAFFPAAFSGGCTEEMCEFRDSIAAFKDVDAQIYGISVDLPFALNRFIEENDLPFPILSDFNQELIEAYGVVKPDMYGLKDVAQRSVFVIYEDGTVAYRWIQGEDEDMEYAELVDDVAAALADLQD